MKDTELISDKVIHIKLPYLVSLLGAIIGTVIIVVGRFVNIDNTITSHEKAINEILIEAHKHEEADNMTSVSIAKLQIDMEYVKKAIDRIEKKLP